MPQGALIQVAAPQQKLEELRALLSPGRFRQALWSATKRTAKSGAVKVGRDVREVSTVSKKYTDRAIKPVVPHGDVPQASIVVSRQNLPLVAFQYRQLKSGVSVKILKDGPTLKLRHVFLATVHGQHGQNDNGHLGLFYRPKARGSQKKTARGYTQRLPILQSYGPSVLSIIDVPETLERVRAGLNDIYVKNITSQISRFSKGQAPSSDNPSE